MPTKFPLLIGLLVLLIGCATSPAQRIDAKAQEWGMKRKVIPGTAFQHVIYTYQWGQPVKTLHVYLDGDGSPWIQGQWISGDPTPLNPLALRLMVQDTNPSLYLGRPCYHGLASESSCTPELWTYGRYSQRVVDSMATALAQVVGADHFSQLVFIGYSGGGTLAMLLAERFLQTKIVVTIAGNLDPKAWVHHHGYTPLWNSLNPSQRPPLDPGVPQHHLFGGKDKNILPSMVFSAVSGQKNIKLHFFPEFDHVCCWSNVWPSVLAGLSTKEPPYDDRVDFLRSNSNLSCE